MSGFKDGASSDDPFGDAADDTDDGPDESAVAEAETGEAALSEAPAAGRDQSTTAADDGASTTYGSGGLPWLYERNSITDGREKTVLFGFKFEDPDSGEVHMQDRSGWYKDKGDGWLFYFQPGHETFPVYYQPVVQQLLHNAVTWAAPSEPNCPSVGEC